ncbi:MAG TPA: helix-turn-helix domain-containing protein [Pseudonocardiaceae bacterium]|nr:helix-turn-helix domain-containing protein [Pseudonocardiaceae bacterium]
MTRRRLKPEERRNELLDAGAEFFANRPYDDVLMEDIAAQVGVSRALLYRYFPGKRELFAAIYQRAADRLLDIAQLDPDLPLADAVSSGLDAHIDYFATNRLTVLAANRTLAGDPLIQAIIDDELAVLRGRILDAAGFAGHARDVASAALRAWLVFVREMCVDWLENQAIDRDEVRATCLRTLFAALDISSQ